MWVEEPLLYWSHRIRSAGRSENWPLVNDLCMRKPAQCKLSYINTTCYEASLFCQLEAKFWPQLHGHCTNPCLHWLQRPRTTGAGIWHHVRLGMSSKPCHLNLGFSGNISRAWSLYTLPYTLQMCWIEHVWCLMGNGAREPSPPSGAVTCSILQWNCRGKKCLRYVKLLVQIK